MTKAITMQKIEGGKPGKVYYPLRIKELPTPQAGPNELLIEMNTAALNHRDLFLRQHLYPFPSWDVTMLADGCGTVTAVGSSVSKSWIGKRVILTSAQGWEATLEGPEDERKFAILGGTSTIDLGTLQTELVTKESEVEEVPSHLTSAEAAALPLAGLTGWRAFVTKSGNALPGRNILVTGVGGGVALNVLQFAVGKGCNVFVTSGNEDKLAKAKQLGASGGVNYKNDKWEKDLQKLLPKDRPYLDAIIDGAGGNIVAKSSRLLKNGGVIVQYGMTVSPKMEWSMPAVLRNIELRGSTMGSRKEFRDMVAFVNEKKIKPVVSRVVKGIDNLKEIDELFDEMKEGSQFGKLVIEIKGDGSKSKL